VQALPSLQAVPFATAGLEQVPVAGLQVPAVWHWSIAVHVTGLAPRHAPAWHASVCVHALPSSHAVPLTRLDHAVVDSAGVHAWQALAGLMSPAGIAIPPMTQPGPQLPVAQTRPLPHDVPSGSVAWAHVPAPSQASVEQGLPSSGQAAPLALSTTVQPPLPSHAELCWQLVAAQAYADPPQTPAVHTSVEVHASPSLHAVPLATRDHAVVEARAGRPRRSSRGSTCPRGSPSRR